VNKSWVNILNTDMKRKNLFVLILIVITLQIININLYSSEKLTFETILDQELQTGKINKIESIAYQFLAVYKPEQLPDIYKNVVPVFTRNTTALKAEVVKMWPQLSTDQKGIFSQYLTRPLEAKLQLSITSPSGLFKIHYTSEGNDAATDEFITQVANVFDYVYDFEVNVLKYLPPPVDDPASPEYDIYVHNIGDYGATTPENPVPGTSRDDYTSWIEIDNDFQHTPTKGLPALQVTAAHEFFHMIQLGYRTFQNTIINSVFLFESCSAWMEDVVYDDVNDYYNYLPSFFKTQDKHFHIVNGTHEYGLAIFHNMLEKKFGRDIIKLIWNEFIDHEPFEAIDKALIAHSSNFTTELAEFAIWNYFTGTRADTVKFYPEGQYYPELVEKESYEVNNTLSFTSQTNQLGFNYYKITTNTSSDYVIQPTFPDPQNWIYSLIIESFESETNYTYCGGNSSKNLSDIRSLTDIILTPIYAKIPTSNSYTNNIDFTIKIERGATTEQVNKIISIIPNPFILLKHKKSEILFKLAEQNDDVYISIFTEHGKQINRIRLGKRPDGLNTFEWDGTNINGEIVVSGVYLFLVEANEIIGPGKIAVIR